VKKAYGVQLLTEQGSIAKDIEAENILEALRAFVALIGYRKGETISITERGMLASSKQLLRHPMQ
jgi:hypothetical protein